MPDTPILGFISADSEFVLQPLILAVDSASVKVIEPALECALKLFSQGLIRGDIDRPEGDENPSVLHQLIDSICKCAGLGEDGIELAVLRVLCTAVRSPCVLIRGDSLILIVKTCYNLYVGSISSTNQICAKVVLAQILMIVYARVEEDSMDAKVRAVTVGELLEVSDKGLNHSLVQFVQNFIDDIVESSQGVSNEGDELQVLLKEMNSADLGVFDLDWVWVWVEPLIHHLQTKGFVGSHNDAKCFNES